MVGAPRPGEPLVRYPYVICDVFTDQRFGGNQLAVLPSAEGLSTEQMQQITREFNFSETTFVLPAEKGETRRVRIFAPFAKGAQELPFAGHPNVGTAFVLANLGELGELAETTAVTFEEIAGVVPITIASQAGVPQRCELRAPEAFSLGKSFEVERVARSVSISPADVVTTVHPPCVASVGMPVVFMEVSSRAALANARVDLPSADSLAEELVEFIVHVYVRSEDDFDIRARVFVPNFEDPATGAANCALAGLLAHHDPRPSGDFAWRIAQGVEMGRPSVLHTRATKQDGVVTATYVGGSVVFVADGEIEVDPHTA